MNQITSSLALRDEQLRLVFRALPVSLIGTGISIIVLSYFLHDVLPGERLWPWVIGFTLVLLFRAGLYLVYNRIKQANTQVWIRWFSLGTFLAGCGWGSLSLWLYPLESMHHQTMIVFAIAGVIAAGTVSLAALWHSFVIFMLPTILPLLYQLSHMPENINLAMVFITCIFGLFMLNSARHSYQNILQNILLRQKSIENEKAILASQYQLEESRLMLRWILDTIPIGVYWKDLQGIYLGCNKVYAAELQLPEHEIIGKTNLDLPLDRQTRLRQCDEQKVMDSCQPLLHQEVCVPQSNGKLRWLDCNLIPLTNINGNIIGTLGAIQDISGQKQLDTMKNEFISTVSHELRTPLTSIRGAIGLLSQGMLKPEDEQYDHLMNIANNNTEKLLVLIDDLLNIQKIESGYVDFRFEQRELNALLETIVQDNLALARHYEVSFILADCDNQIMVNVDPQRFGQVINNLLSNAAKFSHPGQIVEVGCKQHANQALIYVQDYGVGIPHAFRAQLFDRFTQWDASNTRRVGGTGLGLNIARSIIERHQGQIRFESEEGVGTRFEIKLPLVAIKPASGPQTETVSSIFNKI